LKTLEKINRKAIRNSLENGKPISAQTGPLSRVTSVPDRRAPPVGTNSSAPSLPPPLSRCPVGQACRRSFSRPRARFPLLSRRPHLSAVPNLLPTTPRRGRAHVRAFSGHVLAPAPRLSLAPCSPTSPHSLAPSAEPPLALSLALRARPEPRHRPPTSAARSTVAVELPAASVAPVSSALSPATWNTLRFSPNPSGLPGPRSPEFLLCSRSSATVAPSRPSATVVAPRLQRFPSR
jgi:hypothetical protein